MVSCRSFYLLIAQSFFVYSFHTRTNHPTGVTALSAIRLNKVFKATHSRRQADNLIQEGRVSVNDEISYGCMVVPFQDVVALDGQIVTGWEDMNAIRQKDDVDSHLEYVKYWKPRGVTCTTDLNIKGNIVDEITQVDGYRPKHRIYPVGRLDKDTSGLILLTSDGRVPNASLRSQNRQSKVYRVRVHAPLADEDLEHLKNGVVITTVAQRDGKRARRVLNVRGTGNAWTRKKCRR